MIPIVDGALGSITKSRGKRLEEQQIRGRIETIPNIALLRSVRILRRVLMT